jgi:glycosyltransferase involved in cell wall biosynthesis
MRISSTLSDLRRRFAASTLAERSPLPGDLTVFLTMPRWTVYRSTDREYVYERFSRLSESWPLCFLAPGSADVSRWNGRYIVRRGLHRAGMRLGDEAMTPRICIPDAADVVFSYGLYPHTKSRTPVLWEQTFAPQLGMDEQHWTARVRLASSAAVELATRVVTATEVSAEWFVRIFPDARDKIAVAPYYLPHLETVSESDFRAKLSADGPVRLVFVGKQARRKGLDTLVQAWGKLPSATRSQLSISVVSAMIDGKLELPEEWKHLAFAPSVVALLRDAHVLLFPTKEEAYGLVLVEALASGCAALTTHAVLQRSIVGPEAGYFVDPHDADQIAQALTEIAGDRARLAAAMHAARARFESTYHPDIVGAAYSNLLHETAGRSPAGARSGARSS